MTDFQRDLEVIIQNVGITNNGTIRFPMRYTSRISGSVENMELETRALHSLLRNKITTVEQLTARFDKLPGIKGAGNKTIKEIKNAYLAYYYSKLNDEERKDFWRDVVRETEELANGTEE